jgi:hypothetical protein
MGLSVNADLFTARVDEGGRIEDFAPLSLRKANAQSASRLLGRLPNRSQ